MRASLRAAVLILVAACGSSGGGHGELVAIEIEPQNATLTVTGTPVMQVYRVFGTYADGTIEEVDGATYSVDNAAALLGDFTGATFTAHGQGAGKGGVFASVGGLTASTSVIVAVHRTDLGPGVPADAVTKFPDAPPVTADSPMVVYPLDDATLPSSVKAPVVQWEGASGAGDLYRVRIVAGYTTIDTILAHSDSFKYAAQATTDTWQLIKSSSDGTIRFTVAQWDASIGARSSTPVIVRMIDANITGAIYYWNLQAGRMERIDADGRSTAIPSPPQRSDGVRCVACHTVSKDGRYLSGALWDAGSEGAVFDMTNPAVATTDPAPTVTPLVQGSTYTVLFSTFNADASRLMINRGTGLSLIDPKTGAAVAASGLPTSGAAHPSWSPDGSSVVFVNNIIDGAGNPAGWAVDYVRGDLAILPVTAPDTFGAPTTLVSAATAGTAFAAPSWPSFSPDSKWIAYGAGVNSRGRNDSQAQVYPGALFIINKDGGIAYRLDVACNNARDCHLPNFSPYDEGGYYWLVFYSTRDYGNALAGTKGTKRRQLWVTAINKSKLGQADASSVPYWLPDQDVTTHNMSAYWALPPPLL